MFITTLSLTSVLDGVGGQRHARAVLPPGQILYPLCRMLAWPQGRPGRLWKMVIFLNSLKTLSVMEAVGAYSQKQNFCVLLTEFLGIKQPITTKLDITFSEVTVNVQILSGSQPLKIAWEKTLIRGYTCTE